MKKYNLSVLCVIFALLSIAWTLFIFSNSLKNGEQSDKVSLGVVDKIKPIVDPDDKMERSDLNKIVRKLAHGLEFMALGILTCAFLFTLTISDKKRFYALPPVYCAIVAAADEFIQLHTGRTGSIKDVFIDIGGAVSGILLFTAAAIIFGKIKKHTSERKKI